MLLFVLTFGAAAPGVFNLPALDRDESRFAQASTSVTVPLLSRDVAALDFADLEQTKAQPGLLSPLAHSIQTYEAVVTCEDKDPSVLWQSSLWF